MRLTVQTDFALRVLIYLTVRREQWVSSHRLAEVYGVSTHHISKVAKDLVTRGYLAARRGAHGGFRLAVAPAEVRIGDLIHELEPSMDLLECFDPARDQCILTPVCGLRHALVEAQRAFLDTLNGYTLEQVAGDRRALERIFARREASDVGRGA